MRWRWLLLAGVWLGFTRAAFLALGGLALQAAHRLRTRGARVGCVPPDELARAVEDQHRGGITDGPPMPRPALDTDALARAVELLAGECRTADELAYMFARLGVKGARDSRTTNPVCVWFAAVFDLTPVSDLPEWHGAVGLQEGDLVEVADGIITVVTEAGARAACRLPGAFRDFLARYDAGDFSDLWDPDLQAAQGELARQLKGPARADPNP